jgi:hypothetical protein
MSERDCLFEVTSTGVTSRSADESGDCTVWIVPSFGSPMASAMLRDSLEESHLICGRGGVVIVAIVEE